MKAKEVLRRYAAGERNFRGANLQGQVFTGKDLSGTDFSYADIRGTRFIQAKLSGANFTGARVGLQTQWIVLQAIVLLFFVLLSGTLLGFAGALIAAFLMPAMVAKYTIVPGFMAVIVLNAFGLAIVRHGLVVEPFSNLLRVLGIVTAFTFGLAFVSSSMGAMAFVLAVFSAILGTFLAAFNLSVAGNHLGRLGLFGVAMLNAIVSFVIILTKFFIGLSLGASVSASIVVLTLSMLSVHIAQCMLESNRRYGWLRIMSINLATAGRTTFYRSDLTASNFSQAMLEQAALRNTD